MKINLDQVFTDLNGEVVKQKINGKEVPFALAHAAANALLTENPEKKLSGMDKVRNYDLAVRVYKGGNVDLTPEEIVLIKSVISDCYAPLITGQAYKMLEGKK